MIESAEICGSTSFVFLCALCGLTVFVVFAFLMVSTKTAWAEGHPTFLRSCPLTFYSQSSGASVCSVVSRFVLPFAWFAYFAVSKEIAALRSQ
jgi:hypothetical protein